LPDDEGDESDIEHGQREMATSTKGGDKGLALVVPGIRCVLQLMGRFAQDTDQRLPPVPSRRVTLDAALA
jgi:hypothetical protein